MYLINTETHELKKFTYTTGLQYSILSHCWSQPDQGEKPEISYSEVKGPGANILKTTNPRTSKILESCQVARNDLRDQAAAGWMWIDTCCLDESSSAELQEGINSMYSFYQHSKRCYVYLQDVEKEEELGNARWFRRGWTLQELLAPADVVFYNKNWKKLGAKSCTDGRTKSLHAILSSITKIDVQVLQGGLDEILVTSIAKRMSWAAARQTTRDEDIAYCLMGLFQVNMPMIYGEGIRAFLRLQEEIMKDSDDQSLFAWEWAEKDPRYHLKGRGLLAESPKDFALSGTFTRSPETRQSKPYSKTNKGISITLRLSPYKDDLYVAALECPVPTFPNEHLGIFLRRLPSGSAEGQYVRVRAHELVPMPTMGTIQTLYVR